MRPDGLPPEYLAIACAGLFNVFGKLAHRAAEEGVPCNWRGGQMVPIPRRARKPLSLENSRGILLAPAAAAAYAKALRRNVSQHLLEVIGPGQFGSARGRNIEFLPMQYLELSRTLRARAVLLPCCSLTSPRLFTRHRLRSRRAPSGRVANASVRLTVWHSRMTRMAV